MAGIGFRLQKLLSGESYGDMVRAYLYSAIISSGPMLVVMLALWTVKISIQSRLGSDEGALLMSLIVYAYAFSMVLAGPFFYVVTRYLADQYYSKRLDTFTPTYLSVLEVLLTIQSVVALIYLHFLPLSITMKWFEYLLFLFVGGIWMGMIFLSAARNYHWIVWAFLGGGLVGIISSLVLGKFFGLSGYLGGFVLGQGTTFFILTIRIFLEFGYTHAQDFRFFLYFKKYPYLVLVGFFYYLGTWIDKFIFWFSRQGDSVLGPLRVCFNYDTPMFLAFMTIVPSMAFFLIQMETSFIRYYRAYYQGIQHKGTLNDVRTLKENLLENLAKNIQKFVFFQGFLSGVLILFIYELARSFSLNPSQMGIFRIGTLGAFLQMGLLIVMTFFFYFDFQREVLVGAVGYCLGNAVLTLVTLKMGLPAYGFGFTLACFFSVLAGFLMLEQRLKYLEYWTFMRQPIVLPQFKFETENK